ncbi:MAG: hypothetical protein RLZZ618_2882 [Pseudomonadota bacterium]|jgi:hypothetical protein
MKRLSLHLLPVAALTFALSGCTTLEPEMVVEPLIGYDMVDLTRVDQTKYAEDYKQCAVIANQDIADVTRVATRVLGTAADRASMGIIGQRMSKDADRSTVLKRCLTGRGYNVLR